MLGIGSTRKRLPQVPDVSDLGRRRCTCRASSAGTWFGLAVTAGTPRAIIDKINTDVRAVLAEPTFQERFLATPVLRTM